VFPACADGIGVRCNRDTFSK